MTAIASVYGFRRRIQAVLWPGLLAPLLALSSPALAETFAVDVYVTTIPAEGESFQSAYYEGGAVQVPKDAFSDKGTAKFDSRLEGADGLKKSIENAFAKANEKFAGAGVKFEVRNIHFISAEQKDLKSFYQKDNELFSIGMKDGKSGLLQAFDKATADTKGAFRVLLAPIEEHKEVGMAQTPGTVSVINAGSATDSRLNGFGLVHELSHNFGVEKHHGNPLTSAMAEGVPAPERDQKADPKLETDEIDIIKKAVASGRYNDVRMGAGVSAKDEKSDAKKAATQKSEPKKSATPSQDKSKQRKTTTSKRTPDMGKVIQFGIGAGLGAATSSGSSKKKHHERRFDR